MGCALTSVWVETAPPAPQRAPLGGDLDCDVAIIGGGYTGLWTAYYLLTAEPSLRVAVLEAERVGFGASGRNGGWCSALFPASMARLASMSNRDSALAQHRAMVATLDEIDRVLRSEGIDAQFRRGGTVVAARNRAQLTRAEVEVAEAREWGVALELLSGEEARGRLNASGTLGGTYTPDCARVHPLRLVRGLAELVERSGGAVFEGTRVRSISPGRAVTDVGTVAAEVVVRATEGYTASFEGLRRAVIPVYSLIVATEPLPPEVWQQVGLAERETFSDNRNLIVYGQRTEDDRLVFGGRGAPYHWGSAIRPQYDGDQRVFGKLRQTLVQMFPVLEGTRFTHSWGGAVGIARDWCASVGRDGGFAWAGGYVGDGVSTTNLAGRTLRDLVLGHETELTRLPWVNHRSGRWEPEPLRWLEVNAGLKAMTLADLEERVTGRPSVIAAAMSRSLGH